MTSERKCLALYVDAAFDVTYAATDYQIVGKDLGSLYVELNPQIETKQNILGETTVVHGGYQPSASIDTFYHDAKKALEAKVIELAMARKSGDTCKTSCVEVLYSMPEDENTEPEVILAFREDILCVPTSYGGDTTGVQSPFDVQFAGNRVKGDFERSTKKFTVSGTSL